MILRVVTIALLVLGVQSASLLESYLRIEDAGNGPKLFFSQTQKDKEVFKIEFGRGLDFVPDSYCGDNCYNFGVATLNFTIINEGWYRAEWNVKDPKITLKDCMDLKDYSWFGGPEQKRQLWPIDLLELEDFSMITKEDGNCAVIEGYWISQAGSYIYVDEKTPLFVDQNRKTSKDICFSAKIAGPYTSRKRFSMKYDIVIKKDPKEAHQHAVKNFLGKPTGIPNEAMFRDPIWSTWAKYKRDVNTLVVDEFAKEILSNKFTGQFELDDDWEICYGALEFRPSKFKDPKSMVKKLKDQGFRVTLWVHPFINLNCDPYLKEAKEKGYLVKNEKGDIATQWWNSGKGEAALVDFTNKKAAEWWANRLWKLKNETGIDSYKFDAGETSWAPQVPALTGDPETHPNSYTTEYVKTCAQFGDLIEVRSGYRSQTLPIFVRIVDKDTRWTFENGIKTLITTLLQMNMVGYSLVLPDMVGGNLYGDDKIDAELFIRWLQANVFMPSIQYSLVPWDFNNVTVVEISRHFTQLHANYTDKIVEFAKKSVKDGSPLNAPMWWIAPNDPNTYKINDQFLLGDEIIAAPVVEKGQVARDVYLPEGKWKDGNDQKKIYTVPKEGQVIKKYPAPLDVLPYFIKVK